jgi:hypothetical protein
MTEVEPFVSQFTTAELIDEVRAEVKMRHKVYPGQVRSGRLTGASAELKIAKMETVQYLLEWKQRLDGEDKPAQGGLPV